MHTINRVSRSRIPGPIRGQTFNATINLTGATIGGIVAGVQDRR
jgi:hypothetical protein